MADGVRNRRSVPLQKRDAKGNLPLAIGCRDTDTSADISAYSASLHLGFLFAMGPIGSDLRADPRGGRRAVGSVRLRASLRDDGESSTVSLVCRADGSGGPIEVRLQGTRRTRRPLVIRRKPRMLPMVVTGTHDPYLVALSILVAIFASYTALDLGARVAAGRGLARGAWLVAAAITMGGGIWSMHFVAMLAFIMPIPMSYDIQLTALSLVVAILVTGGGFYVISRRRGSPLRLVLSGIFMGLGIVAMHYTGMAAMRGHTGLRYDAMFVALSVVIAIGASTAALWLAFRTTDLRQKLVAAVVMGVAISGMHYTAMRAAIFTVHSPVHEVANASLDRTGLALAIAGITFFILACALIVSLSEQKRAELDSIAQGIERKRAEEALRRSEAYLAEAQRLTHTGSWAYNPVTGRTVYWSEEMFRIWGFDPQQGPPDPEMAWQRIPQEDLKTIRENIEKARRRVKFEFVEDHRIVLPDGTVKHVQVTAHPVVDGSGTVIEYIGTSVDVTERKTAEDSLRKTQEALTHVTRVMTLGEVSASIAHELNQPLAAIVNNANACLGLLPSGHPGLDEVREALEDMVSDAERASAIVERVRRIAKRSAPQQAPLRLADIVEDVVALAARESAARRMAIHTKVPADLPVVLGDRVQLQQVLLNLVVNAMDAMGSVDERDRRLRIRGRLDTDGGRPAVTISVEDHGVGLKAEETHRLFDAFYTTKPHGMGLGLAISRSIIEAHGGRLWATGNPDRGMTFSFTLPLRQRDEIRAA